MGPWSNDRTYLNFAEDDTDAATGYRPDAYRVLQAIRAQVDPAGLFHANHVIDARD
jgi:FAD/FMN-containing dehydrogenase